MQSLVNLSPCFLSGIHFVVMWGHISGKRGFYFSGRVLQFGITLSFSQSSSLWCCSCPEQMPDLCLTALKRKQNNTFQLTKTPTILNQSVSKVLFRLILSVPGVQRVHAGAGADGSLLSRTHINCIFCIKASLHTHGQQDSLFLKSSLAVTAACWFWPMKSSWGLN